MTLVSNKRRTPPRGEATATVTFGCMFRTQAGGVPVVVGDLRHMTGVAVSDDGAQQARCATTGESGINGGGPGSPPLPPRHPFQISDALALLIEGAVDGGDLRLVTTSVVAVASKAHRRYHQERYCAEG